MAKNEVVIKFLGDASGYEKVTNQVAVKTQSVGKTIAGVFGGLQLDRAARQVFQFGQDSIAAFKESEQASARLEGAFAKFPTLADSNAAAFGRLADAQAKKTKFDDDATKSGQAVLAQFGLTGKQIMQLTPLLQDYAAKTGKDLPNAAGVLGKALLGKGRALSEVGLQFKDAGSVGANFEQIMGGLTDKVGGFAEREGKTAAGQAEILKNQFGELQENVGAKLLPVLTKLTSVGLGVVDFFSNLSPGVQAAIGVVAGLLAVVFAITKAVQTWTVVQAAFNVVMSANPVVLVGLAIAALIAAVVIAYQKVGWFRDAVDGIAGVAKGVAKVLGGMFEGMWSAAKTAFNAVARAWNATVGKLSFHVPSWVPVIGGKGWDVPNMPTLHKGGVFQAPFGQSEGLALLRNNEVVLTPEQAAAIGPGGGAMVVNNVTLQTGQALATAREIEDFIVKALESFFGNGGSIGNGRGAYLKPA